jgi:Protein of unknown function (DUF1153)
MGRLARDAKAQMKFIYGPDGAMLTLPDLPTPETRRWVSRKKAEVVAAVEGGLLTLREACDMYALSVEEFVGWQQAIRQHGMEGLRVTHAQDYRHSDMRHVTH